ncbi:MAG TPA: 23S rRNA (pseudouridine(1915)-N(3))-methyltransferase RlmH [Gammaproteobacteria bacterium]|nr:23S rRNA (pseudouridine(1915)-N(3))-methyltransferase RlmH [Gammaproteobacteria bacterium]
MALKIVAIGELTGWCELAFKDYQKRIRPPFTLECFQIPVSKRKEKTPQKAVQEEAQKLLRHTQVRDFVFALDPNGQTISSVQFSQKINDLQNHWSNIVFLIGGPDGFDSSIYNRANALLSLSSFIFPHTLARLMLIEQLYRAYTLASNHPYHRA